MREAIPASRLPIRVLLVDDEPLGNASLRALVASHPDLELAGEAHGGRAAVQLIRTAHPDLVFLDVQMPEVDGFAVLRAVGPEAMPAVIFVTAYDRFAVNAFDVQAIDYLLKPVAADRFARAVERARDALSQSRDGDLARRLRALLDGTTVGPPSQGYTGESLVVRVGRRDVVVRATDIDWIEADDYCAVLHVGARRHVIRATLASLEADLDSLTFLRVHRSAVVNVSRVRELRRRRVGGLVAVLIDGTHLPVSRGHQAQLIERLGERS